MNQHEQLSALLGGHGGASLLFALVALLLRVSPAIWIAPFPGGRLTPPLVKAAVSLAVALVLMPLVAPAAAVMSRATPAELAALLAKEVAVGAALGFVVGAVFWSAEAAGWLMETGRGTAGGASRASAPPAMATLLLLLTLLVFVSLGGHRLYLAAIVGSYDVIPLASFPSIQGLGGFARLCVRVSADVILLAAALSAPVLATRWLVELSLGLSARGAWGPLSAPLRATLGLLVLASLVGLLGQVIPPALDAGIQGVNKALELLGG